MMAVRRKITQLDNPILPNRHIRDPRLFAGAVIKRAAFDQDVELLGG
jgi:hypothetical protein